MGGLLTKTKDRKRCQTDKELCLGSILGPRLFNIHANSVIKINYLSSYSWFYANHVNLKPEKAHYMRFGKKSHIDAVNLIGIELAIFVKYYLISCKIFVWESSTKRNALAQISNHLTYYKNVVILFQ